MGNYKAGLEESAKKIDALTKEIREDVYKAVAKAEKLPAKPEPVLADRVAIQVADKLDTAWSEIYDDLNFTRQLAREEAKGIL